MDQDGIVDDWILVDGWTLSINWIIVDDWIKIMKFMISNTRIIVDDWIIEA